jgi:hypothetical protein
LLLRLRERGTDEFSILRRTVQDLNAEIRRRQRTLVELEAAVRHRDVLLAELHHRVRNTTQMLLGMIAAAERAAGGPELAAFIAAMRIRLLAIGTAQQFMYASPSAQTVPADDFLPALCRALADADLPAPKLALDAIGAEIGNDIAVPLALLVAEVAGRGGAVSLRVEPGDQDALLVIEGAGACAADWSSPLLRGLARQIGLDLSPGPGRAAGSLRLPRPREVAA